MKKRFLFLLLAFLAIFTLAGCKNSNAKEDGKFSVEVIDETDKVLCNETIGFKEGDNIVDLLKANEKIKLDGTMSEYGIYITTLCGKNASDVGKTYFWSLYVDDNVSEVGLSSVELKNGMKIKLVLTDWTKLS